MGRKYEDEEERELAEDRRNAEEEFRRFGYGGDYEVRENSARGK